MADNKIHNQSEQFKTTLYLKEGNCNSKQRETSLIPGLGYMTTGEERFRGRRNAVLDSDSDYVKLAKRGGVPDLLTFGGLSSKSTCIPLKKPEWLPPESSLQENNQTVQMNLPGNMSNDITQDMSEGEKYKLSPTPIETTDTHLSEKEKIHGDSRNCKPGTPEVGNMGQLDKNFPPHPQMEDMTLNAEPKQWTMQSGTPTNTMSYRFSRKKEPPVSMQKLLSFGYADDWFSEREDVKKNKEQNMEEHSVAEKTEVLPEENQSTYRGKRMTGIRGNEKNKVTGENDSFFKIFGEHRPKEIRRSVENRLQSEIALA
ncbi:uncharacterized protein C7orf57 homolog isoform X1 [Stegostoma tigrinum]|uniref:uncharacterized protein C7orf57 homolog isoform X1 n=2 Tax=Stegostoma tigrinum TaxID=3053191 RepID=UPI00202B4BB8|nr:uncharacterized protein C7orf57 homolog isoform X1 [Stegostoma tigrinum]XP_048389676.1 uncharacterized protein C7orf57 homolog isoform X1 [Stegostoma tigrinum]